MWLLSRPIINRLDNRPCENEWEYSRREGANGYRCAENGFYFFIGDGLCYDDEGFSYRFREDDFFYDTETGHRFDAVGFSWDSEGRRLPGASMGLSDDENLRNAPPSSSNNFPTRAERVFVDPFGCTPLSVSREISDEISLLITKGISTKSSKSISKEFALEYVDAEFYLRPPKLDGWISRRALLLPDKGTLKAINASEESFAKTQLRIMDISPPLVDLYARLSSLPDSESLKRPMQAALQQWGPAYFYITKERRSAVMSLAEPGAEYSLRDPDAFEGGKEACSFLFTEKYLQAMLTDASQDNIWLRQRELPRQRPRLAPQDVRTLGVSVPISLTSRYSRPDTRLTEIHEAEGVRGVGETIKFVAIAQALGLREVEASRLKVFAARWPLITRDRWVLKTVREGLLIDFLSEPTQNSFPPQITMSKEMSDVCDAEVRDLLAKRAISEVSDGSIGFFCSFFCVKKKQEGQFRPIVN
ncbi:hypothetical protein OUZ56_012844 [Daphnia magna]|uniref:Uncharacterized protein n=1 Tax=Daphnia magna TaxID=35525 RepID=A0ABQ9Z482_9CRUS|nr:hypothetical protein OUZ56_012844 [Daphnia magna]